ncbi:MAG: hypothetical protein ACYC42_01600 [Lysobacter sp.]
MTSIADLSALPRSLQTVFALGGFEWDRFRLHRKAPRSPALVTLGLYIAGSLLMLHSASPRVWGDVPVFARVVYALALLLSLRLVLAIKHSGRL